MQLSEHFSLDEFIHSETALKRGIDNTPSPEIVENLRGTAEGLEVIRTCLGGLPIQISSGYRCRVLNTVVGGSLFSQHMQGYAVDFTCPKFGTPREIALYLQDKLEMLGIDQLIMEGTWIHASFTSKPRNQLLTLKNGKYVQGLV